MNNKIIVIGEDNTNTFGVVRAFGENNLKCDVFLVHSTRTPAIGKSIFVNSICKCSNEEEIPRLLLKTYDKEKSKPVLITTTDTMAMIIDQNYNILKDKFIVQNINDKQGGIAKCMDKGYQHFLAKSHNLKMANSIIIDLNNIDESKLNSIKYPCIIKPLISAHNDKKDITVVNNRNELYDALKKLESRKYKVIIEEYLKYDYEVDISGFCYNKNVSISGITRIIRGWPIKGGTVTYGELVTIDNFHIKLTNLENLFKAINYNGLFDVELFIMGNDYYLNEINFRNSGIGRAYDYGKSYVPYYWALSVTSNKMHSSPISNSNYYFINNHADIHNLIARQVGPIQYIKDYKNSKIKLLKHSIDKKPDRQLFINKVKSKIGIK